MRTVVSLLMASFLALSVAAGAGEAPAEGRNTKPPQTIRDFSPGAVDDRGNHYTRSGPGVVDPKDGAYYSPSGTGGYINSKTGEYVPMRNR